MDADVHLSGAQRHRRPGQPTAGATIWPARPAPPATPRTAGLPVTPVMWLSPGWASTSPDRSADASSGHAGPADLDWCHASGHENLTIYMIR